MSIPASADSARGVPLPTEPGIDTRKAADPPAPLECEIIDAHTHLDACGCVSADDIAAVMDRAKSVGVVGAVTVADDLDSAIWAAWAATQHPNVYAAIGLHPTRADMLDTAARSTLEKLACQPKVVAIGETGLDYYWDAADRAAQREAFAWHIDLAKRNQKPLMIHDREAHDDVLEILRAEGAPDVVIFHCFSGDAAMARVCVDKGYILSFAGPVSFKNSRDLQEAATLIPPAQMMLETDAPFLTPHPQRGRRNEPYALPYTLRAVAALRNVDENELGAAVIATTRRVYGLGGSERG
ncbi:TatD family deoxyribonuclease [Nakamurella antarctica]|uniref:TatD family deoxyribonuclease n=1 Tax=Nakamurella antarctica TaxID=1902245 RepID=A0A3G8ZU67_9ACTN|nr:TatD family hydrolase [Nakamurella antarctica]AZI57331.1 TatD family deoxyribonuclease [Nakamurella antarctica]